MGRCSLLQWQWDQEDATSIQRIVRGYLVRRNSNINPWDFVENNGQWARPLPRIIREKYVVDIQRLYRGFVARKFWPGIKLFTYQ